MNELSKRYLASKRGVDPKNLSLWDRLASGAVAGLSYWVGTYPLDVIKVRFCYLTMYGEGGSQNSVCRLECSPSILINE